jgi:WD40 repeat protein
VRRSIAGIVKELRASHGRVAIATSSGIVALFSTSGEPLSEVPAHADGADTVAWHPGGQLLASGGQDRKVRLWRIAGEVAPVLLAELEGLTGDTHFLAFSPSGDRLFAGDDDGLVASWRIIGEAVDPGSRVILARHGGAISALALSRDGHYLASCGLDKSLTRVDLTTDLATTLPFGDVATTLTFDESNNLYAVTRTGAVGRATSAGAALLLDHGATAGAAIPPGQLAIALDDGAILVTQLQSRSFAALRATLGAGTSYQLPESAR